jgi:hypothetical protein
MNRADDSMEQAAANKESDAPPSAGHHRGGATRPAFSDAPAFHSDDVEHVANYRALSVLALLGLLLGIASPFSFLAKGFLLLPLCGFAVSLLALRRIALSDGRLAGRWAAITGLALCVTCGAAAITREAVYRHLRTSHAQKFATQWLALVAAHETDQAFKATYLGARPPAPPEPGMPVSPKTPYETFLSDPLIQQIMAAGKDAKIHYVNTLEFTPQTRQDVFVRQQFSIVPADGSAKTGSTDPIEAYLTLQRSRFRGDPYSRWLVTRFEPTAAPAP